MYCALVRIRGILAASCCIVTGSGIRTILSLTDELCADPVLSASSCAMASLVEFTGAMNSVLILPDRHGISSKYHMYGIASPAYSR